MISNADFFTNSIKIKYVDWIKKFSEMKTPKKFTSYLNFPRNYWLMLTTQSRTPLRRRNGIQEGKRGSRRNSRMKLKKEVVEWVSGAVWNSGKQSLRPENINVEGRKIQSASRMSQRKQTKVSYRFVWALPQTWILKVLVKYLKVK